MANQRVVKALGESFSFTLTNSSGAAKVIAITAAFFNTLLLVEGAPNTYKYTNPAEIVAAGYACDGVLDDGTVITGVTATTDNSQKSIRSFRRFIERVGSTVIDMDVQGSNVDVFNSVMKVVTVNPYGGDNVEFLKLNKFLSVDQSSTSKIVTGELGLDLGPEVLTLLPIGDGRTITITFNF